MNRALFCLVLCPCAALAADYVVDPLTSGTMAGRGSRGGTFGANGWTTTAANDSLWWQIPDALPEGSIEFTLSNAQVGTTLVESDIDLLAVYQAPDNTAEPISYTPYFRNNDMKVFTRVFGQAAGPGIEGSYKLNLTFCPVGPPWYDNTAPANCNLCVDTLAYARAPYADIGWDAATSYRLILTWGNGTMSFSRNGEALGSVSYPGTFAPKPMTVRIGGPRNAEVTGSSMGIGIVVSDVHVYGTSGAMSMVCGGTPPPVDAGCVDGALGAIEDVTAASYQTGVFSDPGDLNPEQGVGIAYLKFAPLGGTATSAILHLHSQDFASAAGGSGHVCRVDDSSWSESTLTWANKPPLSSVCTTGEHPVGPDEEVTWDVTALLTGSGTQSLAVTIDDADSPHYYSKESGGCAMGPRLYATIGSGTGGGSGAGGGTAASGGGTAGGAGGTGGGSAGTGGSGAAGGGTGGGSSPGGGSAGGGSSGADGGSNHVVLSPCGCGSVGPGLLPLLALMLVRRRRVI